MDATLPQRSFLGWVRLERVRPWFLRGAVLLRIVALALCGSALYRAGWPGIALGSVLALSAVGLWYRRAWPWRAALAVDIGLVIFFAIKLVDTTDLGLFSFISAAAVIDVVLLGLGQAALARPPLPQ